MKRTWIILLFINTVVCGQITLDHARDSAVKRYHISSYSYHESFIGRAGYGAPLILTRDGGATAFGDSDEGTMMVRLGKSGRQLWRVRIAAKGDEMEPQSVVEDKSGNFYAFILVYDNTRYRGGCERVIFLDESGVIKWDKYIGSCNVVNNPTVAYIRSLDDGRIALRGQVVTDHPVPGKDPVYHFWEGWLNNKGVLTQKAGDVIDWSKPDWKKRFSPE